MLTQIRISNPHRTDLDDVALPVFGPTKFPISFVDGLGPVKAEISSSPYANQDGDHFQSSRVGARNIVLTLELVPSYSSGEDPEDLRNELYGVLAPKSSVDLVLYTTNGIRYISGVVESFESPLFVQVPAVQVSILCHNPFFTGGIKVFEATTPYDTPVYVMNEGTASTGLTLRANMSTAGSEFIFSNDSFSDEKPLHINHIFNAAGSIYIDTNFGRKQVRLLTSPYSNLLPYAALGSGWPRLRPGMNALSISYSNVTGSVDARIEFVERFVGL